MPRAATKTPPPSVLRRVRFGDIAINVNDRVDNPSEAGVDRYVGLEHLDPESLKIRRWGSPSDVEATKLLFRKGDIIFGRRRAYQRKLAVADFDGICSAHAMVLRARPDAVLPEFLPFFMQSDTFMERAIAISVGSLSPTINWKTLAQEEFGLPPLDAQRRIASALMQFESVFEGSQVALEAARKLQDATINHLFSHRDKSWVSYRLETLGEISLGRAKSPKFTTGRCPKPYLRVGNLTQWRLNFSDVQQMDFEGEEFEHYRLRPGDILITEGDIVSPLNVGRAALFGGEIEGCCFQNHLIRFRAGPKVLPYFALGAFRYMHMQREFAKAAKTTTVTSLGVKRFSTMVMDVPPLRVQRRVTNVLQRIWDLDQRVMARLEVVRALKVEVLATALG